MKNKMYKNRIFSCLLAGVMLFSLSACGKADDKGSSSVSVQRESSPQSMDDTNNDDTNNNETTAADEQSGGLRNSSTGDGENRILIVYFTAAENSGVDAIASDSYTTIGGEAVGRVRAVADMIQAQTGGDLFSIQTSTVYPADGGELIDQAAEEQNDDFRPELTSHIENLDDYEIIFVGYPNWWYDMPMAMYSFFEEYDFSGKTIIPFNVHNGSRFSSTISTIQELEPDASVVENGFTVSERSVADAEADVQTWLEGLGY